MTTKAKGHDWQEIPCNLTGGYLYECADCGAQLFHQEEPDGSSSSEYTPPEDEDAEECE